MVDDSILQALGPENFAKKALVDGTLGLCGGLEAWEFEVSRGKVCSGGSRYQTCSIPSARFAIV